MKHCIESQFNLIEKVPKHLRDRLHSDVPYHTWGVYDDIVVFKPIPNTRYYAINGTKGDWFVIPLSLDNKVATHAAIKTVNKLFYYCAYRGVDIEFDFSVRNCLFDINHKTIKSLESKGIEVVMNSSNVWLKVDVKKWLEKEFKGTFELNEEHGYIMHNGYTTIHHGESTKKGCVYDTTVLSIESTMRMFSRYVEETLAKTKPVSELEKLYDSVASGKMTLPAFIRTVTGVL